MVRFRFNADKFVNAVTWFATQCADSTKLKICKLLYYADKEHLILCGRPIIGDTYYKLQNGPIPTVGLNILRGHSSPANEALAKEFFDVRGWRIIPKRDPDMSVFSKSDVRALEYVRDNIGHLSAYALRDKSHKESWWNKTEFHSPIDFELLIEGDSEEAHQRRALLREEQEARDTLRRYISVV